MIGNDSSPAPAGPDGDKGAFMGEEGGGDRSSPPKDLAAAAVIALIAVAAMALAVRLPNPGTFFTAPGLLPFLTGLGLLAMAAALAVEALRGGGGRGLSAPVAGLRSYLAAEDSRRALLLIAIVVVYVIAVGSVSFDLRYPTAAFTLRFSSYEAVSIPALALILRLFWRATTLRCAAVAAVAVVALASVFRFGFEILLPGAG
jgi:hypothetical protein